MLHMAPDFPISDAGGARYQCERARANVRLLLILHTGVASTVEALGDRRSDCAVRVQFWCFGFDAVLPFYRNRVLRDLGLVL